MASIFKRKDSSTKKKLVSNNFKLNLATSLLAYFPQNLKKLEIKQPKTFVIFLIKKIIPRGRYQSIQNRLINLQKTNFSNEINIPKKKWWDIEIGKVVPDRVLLQVTRQMSILGSSGVPVLESIELLVKSTKHKQMKKTLEKISTQIKNGNSLSKAVASFPEIFPIYYGAIIEASEHSGDLNTAFNTLNVYIERDFNAKRTIKSASLYPIILVVISIIAIFILSIIVLPKFEVFFASLNAELPLPTKLLLNYAKFMANNWKKIALVILVILLGFRYFRSKPFGRRKVDQAILKLPIIGRIIELIILERFTRILGTLSNAGVPILKCLDLASKTLNNVIYTDAIKKIADGILQGRGFVDPLEETKVFPEETIQILRVGEQSGRLSEQLDYASSYYGKEVDYLLKNAGNLLEPVLLIFVGSGVGFVAIALVSAMYGIYSSNSITGG